ncbi:endonuclease III domain-containing protein [Verrucomicrobia bacterium S94]|nr:endonuclease III domain-containing protein [Verrucomicrobia bacterium S94]
MTDPQPVSISAFGRPLLLVTVVYLVNLFDVFIAQQRIATRQHEEEFLKAHAPPIHEIFKTLLNHYGEQHWWPAESRLEMMIGAILTQNTAWSNVEKALSNLRKNNALDFRNLEKVPAEQLTQWIQPAGFFNQKAAYLQEMISNIRNRFDGSLDVLFALEKSELRKELLNWKGIGKETADCIILYAAAKPVFVVDAYTRRICSRHHWIDEKTKYDEVADLFTRNLPENVQLFNEFHALIVQTCKDHCTARKPNCKDCPLKKFL